MARGISGSFTRTIIRKHHGDGRRMKWPAINRNSQKKWPGWNVEPTRQSAIPMTVSTIPEPMAFIDAGHGSPATSSHVH